MWEFVSGPVPEAIGAERYAGREGEPRHSHGVDDAVTKDSRGIVHIIEVGYCWDPIWVGKKEETEPGRTPWA